MSRRLRYSTQSPMLLSSRRLPWNGGQKRSAQRVPRLLFAATLPISVLLGACGESGGSGPSDTTGVEHDGAVVDTGPQGPTSPRLLPCPPGWQPREDEGPAFCDPWPEGGPVSWSCPDQWAPRSVGNGIDICAPTAAWAAVKRTCPDGWLSVQREGGLVEGCDPYPAGTPDTCGPYEFHLPGGQGCEPVGARCPAGAFPADLPSDRPVVYVRTGAAGGDGTSPESPWGRLRDVPWNTLPENAIVALARGVYADLPPLTRSVSIWGACAAETVLTTTGNASMVLAVGVGISVELRNLRLDGAGRGRGVDTGFATIRMNGVVIDAPLGWGVWAELGQGLLSDVLIRDVAPSPPRAAVGIGILGFDSRLTLQRVVIEQADVAVLSRAPGAVVEAEDIVVREGNAPTRGAGALVEKGARLALKRFLIERQRTGGVRAMPGTELELTDGVIRDAKQDAATGIGLFVEGRARVRGVEVLRSIEAGILIQSEGATLQLESVYVADTSARSSGDGWGLFCDRAASVDASGVAFARNQETGMVSFRGCSLAVEDGAILDTRPAPDGVSGSGVIAATGSMNLTRVVLSRNHTVALSAQDSGRLNLQDVVAEDTLAEPASGTEGSGLSIRNQGQATLSRVAFVSNRSVGALVTDPGSALSAEDLVVANTEAADDGRFGRGLSVQLGAQATVRRAALPGNRDVAVFVGGSGSDLKLEEAAVVATRSRQVPFESGIGIFSQDDAKATLKRVVVDRNREIGIGAIRGSELDLEDVVVRRMSPVEATNDGGRGLVVQDGVLTARRVLVQDTLETGLVTLRSTVALEDVLVNGVLRPPCALESPPCANTASGWANVGSVVEARRLWIRRARTCGLLLTEQSTPTPVPFLDIEDWVLEENAIAICALRDLLDLEDLQPTLVNNSAPLLQGDLPPPPRPIEPLD